MHTPAAQNRCRQQLVAEFQPRVRAAALRLKRQRALPLELDELVSIGNVGLLEAVDRFDPSRGASFEAFAIRRVIGAMIDHVRSQVWAPRSVVARARTLVAAQDALQRRTGRAPTRDEMASHLGISPSSYDAMRASATPTQVISGDQKAHEDGSETVLGQCASPELPLDERFIAAEQIEWTHVALSRLAPPERSVLSLYYLDEKPVRAIAEELGWTEARVAQVQRQGLRHLRAARIAEDGGAANRPIRAIANQPRIALDRILAK